MANSPAVGSRRAGYVVGALVNVAMLVLIHWWPTWRAVPFLTEATREVLAPITVALVLGIVTNIAFVAYDRRWFVAVCRIVAGAAGLAATARMLRVFPFDFGPASGWLVVARIVLIVGVVGGAIGVLVQFVALVASLRRPRAGD